MQSIFRGRLALAKTQMALVRRFDFVLNTHWLKIRLLPLLGLKNDDLNSYFFGDR